jgi:NADPH:quinone reductase-like Zn-dependent oxidoreductase
MQAIMVDEPGGPDVLRPGEAAMPQPGPEEVLVRVLAAGVGPWDVSRRTGALPGSFPYVPGLEFAGVVEGGTGDAAAFEDGEPVYGYRWPDGSYASYVVCPAEQLAPVPTGLDMDEAAAVPVCGVTALQGLVGGLDITSGDTVLITAASGGVGHLAVQIARVFGANVIATASPQHHDFVHTLGAELVVDHTKPDWPEQVRSLAGGGGVAKVLACAAPTLAGAAEAASDGGVIATMLHADLPERDGVRWHTYDGKPSGTDLIRMAPWFNDGSLSVHVSRRFYWKDAAAAHREIENGHEPGKLLLIVDDDLAAQIGI